MVEATNEDLAITIRVSRQTIWDHPHIAGKDVLTVREEILTLTTVIFKKRHNYDMVCFSYKGDCK